MPAPKVGFRKDKGISKGVDVSRPLFVYQMRGYKTPCWVWQRYINTNGYGQTTRCGKRIHTHVLYWTMVNGPVPEGLEIDHLCRVRACCRPDHLEAVTRITNAQRGAKTKVSNAEVMEIVDLYGSGLFSQREIGTIYGISAQRVGNFTLKGERCAN